MSSGLGALAARGGGITVAVQALRFAVQLTALVLLGRILSPADFGLLAMVTAVIGVGDVLRDFGLSSAAVQATVLSRAQASNLFWINTGIGAVLALACVALAPALADWYGDDRLRAIGQALAVTLLLSGAQTQLQAQLTRDLRYTGLSFSDLGAQVAGVVVALGLALAGAGYWALVAQLVVQSATLLVTRWRLVGWRPDRPRRDAGMAPLLAYGRNLASTQVLVHLSTNVDAVALGATSGALEVGFYRRAHQLLMMPLNQLFAPLTAVALPVLSRLRDDRAEYWRFVRRGQLLVAYPAVAVFAVSAACAPSAVPLLFGAPWAPVAPLFTVLAVGGAFQMVNYVLYWVFLSLGRTAEHLRYSVVSRCSMVGLVLAGTPWGATGVAWGFSTAAVLSWPLALWWLGRSVDLPTTALLAAGARVIGVGATAAVAGSVLAAHLGGVPAWSQVVLTAAATVLAAVAAGAAVPACRRDLGQIGSAVRSLGRDRQAAAMSGGAGR